MIFEQHYLACLSQASYLIGDESTKSAVVVDPRRDVELYLERAAELGLTIRHVFLTHFHADFVAGHLELVERTGCALHLGAAASAEYDFTPARQGDVLELGRVRIEVLETPGHTPESICLALTDLDDDAPAPHKLLTGDTLFIGDVGRPDLLVSIGHTAEDLAASLYDSLRTRVLPLPDSTVVYPGHGAGSACGKSLSSETWGSLGAQKRTNWALRPMEREAFVRELTAQPSRPPAYFAWDADYNRRLRPTLEDVIDDGRRELSLDEVLAHQSGGAVVLDVRVPDVYAAGHLAGSINVGLNGRFASWVGTVVPRGAEIVVVAEPGSEEEAITRLGRIGYDRVAGCLRGGAAAWVARPDVVRRHRRMDVGELAAELAGADAPAVIDVRAPGEYEGGHIEGALLVPLDRLDEYLERVPRERPFVVQCQGGYRSSIAASLLERHGITVAGDLIGGYRAWTDAGQPVVTEPS